MTSKTYSGYFIVSVCLFVRIVAVNISSINSVMAHTNKVSAVGAPTISDEKLLNLENGVLRHFYQKAIDGPFSYTTHHNRHHQQIARVKRAFFFEYDIPGLLASNSTTTFLNSFENLLQREVVAQHLTTCPATPLCNFQLPVNIDKFEGQPCCGKCECRPNCYLTNKCCPDYSANLFRQKDPDEEIKATCSSALLVEDITTKEVPHYWIIRECPENTEEELKNNCSDPYTVGALTLRDVAIVVAGQTNTFYRNRYCAVCNSQQEETLQDWGPYIDCNDKPQPFASETDLINTVLSQNHSCNLQFMPPFGIPFTPCYPIISRCNLTGGWKEYDDAVQMGCLAYELQFRFKEITYRNIMCAVCNGMDRDIHLPAMESDDRCDPAGAPPTYASSFKGLLTFLPLLGENPVVDSPCPDGYVYDQNVKFCRQLYCSDLHYLVNDQCIQRYSLVNSLTLCAAYDITPLSPVAVETLPWILPILHQRIKLLHEVLDVFRTAFCETKMFVNTGIDFSSTVGLNVSQIASQNWTYVRAYVTVQLITRPIRPKFIMERLLSVSSFKIRDPTTHRDPTQQKEYIFHVSPADCYRDGPTNIPPHYFKLRSEEGRQLTLLERMYHNSFPDLEDNTLVMPFAVWISTCKHVAYIYPYNSFLDCPMVKVDQSIIPGTVRSNNLWIPAMNLTVEYGQFYRDFDRKSIYICADVFLSMKIGYKSTGWRPTMSGAAVVQLWVFLALAQVTS